MNFLIPDQVACDVEVKFADGAKCVVHSADVGVLCGDNDQDLEEGESPDRNYDYFPSQRVSAAPSVWKKATWISGEFKTKQGGKSGRKYGIVTKVTPVTVFVEWILGSSNG